MSFLERALDEQDCAMVRLGNMELVLRSWEVGEPSALLEKKRSAKAQK